MDPRFVAVVKNALFAQYGHDPIPKIQQRGLNVRRLEKQINKNWNYHHTYHMMDEARSQGWYGATWRSVTSGLFADEMQEDGTLATVPFRNIQNLMLATRQRMTMQRFVAALKRLVRARPVRRRRLR